MLAASDPMTTTALTPLVGNPLLDAYDELVDLDEWGWTAYRHAGTNIVSAIADGHEARARLAGRYSWAVPTEAVIARLARHAVVEIGAGTGYWAALIARAGGDVMAYDAAPIGGTRLNEWHGLHGPDAPYHPVMGGDATAAGLHPERTLLLCWPPWDDPMAWEALSAYHGAGGRRVVYVGVEYGCTGDDQFHDALYRNWRCVRTDRIPQWPHMSDNVTWWVR